MAIVDLTAAYLRALQLPATGRLEIWDSKTEGLCLRVTSKGSVTWSFRYRPRNGAAYERITLGPLKALSLADARERAARHRVTVLDGGNPQKDRRDGREAAKTALTFDALAAQYITTYAKPNKASWKQDEQQLARPRAKLGSRDMASITKRDLIEVLDEIAKTAPVSANRTQTILVKMLNWAVESDLLSANPISGLRKRGGKEAPKERALNDAELRVLWKSLLSPEDVGEDVADALLLLLLLGQRPIEVAGMLLREISGFEDEERAAWECPASRHKSRRAHLVPLNTYARRVIRLAIERRQRDGDEHGSVFASKFTSRATLARHSLSQGLGRVIERMVVQGPDADAIRSLKAHPPTPHDFRRTVISGMSALGITAENRRAVTGHSEKDVHGTVYDKYDRLREKRAALGAWETHIGLVTGAVEKRPATNVLTLKKRAVQ
ncbi:integrase family protein [Methylobacterium sp. J-072]|uniref:tyrosine-type recombinase/integrase n=1 Tax=Methylobacterium sp. J-072 TaxID=2836651 RepID=UPI001FBB0F53|nr:integrase family protein [Methylobacterium sp. J-072]MCJ2091973.1 integrase family protein [Methylobacterium sp. J-072]